MSQVIYSHEGLLSADAVLRADDSYLYKSHTRVPTNSRYRRITNSVIPKKFVEPLAQFSGRYLLNAAGNVHVFSDLAHYADGTERICYLQYDAARDAVIVREHGDRRGAGYSALFPALVHLLTANGFPGQSRTFYVSADRAADFVVALNRVDLARRQGALRPEKTPVCMSIALPGKKYFYHKLYWDFEDPPAPKRVHITSLVELGECVAAISTAIKTAAEKAIWREVSPEDMVAMRRAISEWGAILDQTEKCCEDKLCLMDLLDLSAKEKMIPCIFPVNRV